MLIRALAVAALPVLAHGACAFVEDDLNDCPLTWQTDPAGTRCVPRPAGYSDDGINRSAELTAHPYVPFNNSFGDLIINLCPQYENVCCTDYQMCVSPVCVWGAAALQAPLTAAPHPICPSPRVYQELAVH